MNARSFPLIINGEAVHHDPVEVLDPATGELVGLASRAAPEHVGSSLRDVFLFFDS